jgi:HK97 family phage prohead protease
VLDPGGWVLDNFKRNPIAFFAHNNEKIVGQWENLRSESGQLLAEFKDLDPGTSALADEVTKLVDQGVLKAASVGFVPLEQPRVIDPKNPQRGSVYPKNELLEVSLVGVPSNSGALSLARSMGLSAETMSLIVGEHAEEMRWGITTGEHAENRTANGVRPSGTRTLLRVNAVTTLSERIQDVQQGLNEKNDKRDYIASADPLDVDALEALNVDIETAERALAALLSAEAGNAARAQAGAGAPAPASGSSGALTVQEQRQRTNLPAPAYNRHPLGFPQPKVETLARISMRSCGP